MDYGITQVAIQQVLSVLRKSKHTVSETEKSLNNRSTDLIYYHAFNNKVQDITYKERIMYLLFYLLNTLVVI